MSEPTLSLHRKLAQVMYEAERIPKRGKAPAAMGGYEFVQVGDAADYIRKALAAQVITMMPVGVSVVGQVDRPTKSGGSMTTVDLVVTWRLTDGESGEFIEIQSFGAGADGGDKYSGKASTSAMKYALLSGFLLSTGEDTELSGDPGHKAPGQGMSFADEARQKQDDGFVLQGPAQFADADEAADGLIGTVTTQGQSDFNLRMTPDGHRLPFRLKNGRQSFICQASDAIAVALDVIREDVLEQRVTVWGTWSDESFPKGKTTVKYRRLNVTRIKGDGFEIPAQNVEALPETVLFSDSEDATIDAAIEAAAS